MTDKTGNFRLKIAVLLVVFELLSVIIAYQLMASIECRLTDAELACRAVRSLAGRSFAILAVVGLFFRIRPKSHHHLAAMIRQNPGARHWLGIHLVGVCLVFLPLLVFGSAEINRVFLPTLGLMLAGALVAAVGLFAWLTQGRNWTNWLHSDHFYLPMVLIGGALVPDLAEAIRPIWNWSSLSGVTFKLVYLGLTSVGTNVVIDQAIYGIGLEGFNVRIASQCSGVEGIALIAIFMALYAILMRQDLRQTRFWLVLFPLAILASWLFNIVRIIVLILIGARVSPEHALNGFHSYAGWLLFTCLALAILMAAHTIRWFHASQPTTDKATQLSQDDIAAQILPFIVMMLSGVVASVFWQNPASAYPVRAALMALALLYFRRYLARLFGALDPVSISAGLGIGGLWLMTAGWPLKPDPASISSPSLFWIASRIIGTVLLVPIIEELFFRGYLLRRLDWGGTGMRIFAIALSSLLFGLMHDRALAGALSGVVFGLLLLRKGRLSDAISAHMTANAVIVVWALIQLDWGLI